MGARLQDGITVNDTPPEKAPLDIAPAPAKHIAPARGHHETRLNRKTGPNNAFCMRIAAGRALRRKQRRLEKSAEREARYEKRMARQAALSGASRLYCPGCYAMSNFTSSDVGLVCNSCHYNATTGQRGPAPPVTVTMTND